MKFKSVFYISNILSITRVFLLIPIYLLLILQTENGNYLAVVIMWLVVATDYLDGYLARKFKQKSDLGRILDPLADKICVIVLALILIILRDLPTWYLVLLIARDLAILLLGLHLVIKMKEVPESNKIGKVTVAGLAVVLISFTLEIDSFKWIFLWISVALIAISSISYCWRTIGFYKNKKSIRNV